MADDDNSGTSNILVATGVLNPLQPLTELHLPGGKVVRLRTALLEGAHLSPVSPDPSHDSSPDPSAHPALEGSEVAAPQVGRYDETVIPLVEERLQVARRTVTTGTVRLQKTVQEYTTQLDEPLAVRTYDIERVILNQPVVSAPAVRQEGDTTIYPLVEEQLILTKQLVLKEELRVSRRDTERRDTQTVVLRREHMTVERENAS